MSEIIDGWNKEPVNKIILSPGSRAWLHRYGLQNPPLTGEIEGFNYSYTINTSGTVNINKPGKEPHMCAEE